MGQQSRRALLRDGVLSIGPAFAGTSIFTKLGAQLNSSEADNNGHTLVVLQLAGGNDGLNAVIPYTDPIYAQSRPTIGIPRAQVVPLTGTLGLHPQLAGLLPLWQAGHMAVVENVGYPNPNLSHFQSTYIWQTLDLTGARAPLKPAGWDTISIHWTPQRKIHLPALTVARPHSRRHSCRQTWRFRRSAIHKRSQSMPMPPIRGGPISANRICSRSIKALPAVAHRLPSIRC